MLSRSVLLDGRSKLNVKLVAKALLISILVVGITPAYSEDVIDEQVVPGSISQLGDRTSQYGVFFEESVDTLRMPSLLYGYRFKDNQVDAIDFCKSTSDPACAGATNFKYYSLFQPCLSKSDVDCIESVYAMVSESPVELKGEYQRTMPSVVAKPFEGNSSKGIPSGGNAGIWKIPSVKHKGGSEEYAVIVSQVGDVMSDSDASFPEFRAAIFPVSMVKNPGYKANVAVINNQGNTPFKHVGINHPGSVNFEPCAIVEDGGCALRQSFPEGYQFGLRIRFSQSISGWLHGRISSPQIDYQLTSPGTLIDMRGYPTRVPIVGGWVDASKFTDQVKREITSLPYLGGTIFPGASGSDSMRMLIAWSKLLNESAIANPTQWIFYNLPKYQMQSSNKCIQNSKTLAGFVTTNSTTYAAGPPEFNAENQSLDYKVASAHFLKNGEAFKGEYNLYIDSKVARCIYSFSTAPVSASVSILSDNGEAKVATTVLTERGGWIHLSASGFTFSSPTIRVKLTQGVPQEASQVVAAEVKPTPIATQAAPKKTTITCSKGGKIKMVTGVKPKCPSGWKKK